MKTYNRKYRHGIPVTFVNDSCKYTKNLKPINSSAPFCNLCL